MPLPFVVTYTRLHGEKRVAKRKRLVEARLPRKVVAPAPEIGETRGLASRRPEDGPER